MVKKKNVWIIPLVLGTALLPACGSNSTSNGASPSPSDAKSASSTASKEPIAMTLYNAEPGAFDFDNLGITDALKKKFPNITFTVINAGKGTGYADIVGSGINPDIIYESASFTASHIIKYNYQYDLQDLVKKHNMDLNRFAPNVVDQVKSMNSDRKLYGIPYTVNRYALFYDKDVFDKFGVAYPKDGMTWDDVYELAKKLTRQDGGVNYQGFNTAPNLMMLNNQLSLSPLDLKEDKAAINNDGWKTLFQTLGRFFEIPGAQLLPNNTDFSKGTLAMVVDSNPNIITWTKANPNLNFDLVSIPTLKEKPKTGYKPASLALFVSQTSKHKDDAFDVISYLVSDEMETLISRKGIGTPLLSSTVRQAYGLDQPEVKGKNTQALYYYPDAAPSPQRAPGLTDVSVDFTASFADMVRNHVDVNTELQKLDEQVNKMIADTKSSAAK